MELWQILTAVAIGALMIGLVVYSIIKYHINHKDYAVSKRMNRVYPDKKVLKEIEECKKSGRSGCVFDGKINDELKSRILAEGHDVDEYTDNRGYPCTRVFFKK